MIKVAMIFIVHMGLAYLMKGSKMVSTLHAIGVLAIGIPWVLSSVRFKKERIVYLCAYITGAEVLWRMTKSLVFWEYGKYAILLVLLITTGRHIFSKKISLVFLFCLIPSLLIVLEIAVNDFGRFRRDASQNLSGPLALAVCYSCLSKIKLTGEQFRMAIINLISPLIGAAFLCFFGLYRLGETMKFGTESNFAASGGFGPNQVSAVLGLGALLVFLYCLDPGRKKNIQNLLIPIGAWFAGQSALTFSRAGIAYALASIFIAALFFIQKPKIRNRFIFFSIVVVLLGNFLILPKLDKYTDGNLTARFSERNTTNRGDIAKREIQMFTDHPVFGLGVGQAKYIRLEEEGLGTASHTEFSRLLAEHGSFGVVAILILFFMGFNSLTSQHSVKGKAYAVALVSWSLFFMLGNGMRLVAPSFIFGLGSIILLPDMPKFHKPPVMSNQTPPP